MSLFSSIGRATCEACSGMRDTCAVLGETLSEFAGLFTHPKRFRFRDFALAFQRAAFEGMPVMIGVGFLLGLILAFQSAAALSTYGVESYVANMLAIALFRELGPLVTAILLAGRSASAFAAEIGAMKVDEELDALVTMGLAPVRFLVLPRILAAVLAMPVLTIFVELAALAGGALVLKGVGIPAAVYWEGVSSSCDAFMIVFGLSKAALFGLLVGFVGCLRGMRTKTTSDGVGVSATAAVVGGIVSVAVADGILAVICHVWGV